jgi:hypothetical protein
MKPTREFWVIWGLTIIPALIGVILLFTNLAVYGIAIFCILPTVIGFITGIYSKKFISYLGIVAGLISIFLLLIGAGEGIICILMALPVIFGFIALGSLIGYLIRKADQNYNSPKVIFFPILILIISSIGEKFFGESEIKNSISTSLTLPYDKEAIYKKIIAVDTVDIEQNFLQKLGLPTPRKCILTQEKIGGLRICKFEEGTIIETIKDLKHGELLRMDITKSDITMNWLKFDEDIYTIKSNNDGTSTITRTTSYFSELKPRFYWKYIENLTIGSEQAFVFRNLKKDLAKK